MATKHSLVNKISDFLDNRQKTTNFGTCKRCSKNVYWSTTKVASHIRSGHCSGASAEEVNQFKKEFVYETPKNLVRKSCSKEEAKESFKRIKQEHDKDDVIKRTKLELNVEQNHILLEEQSTSDENELDYDQPTNEENKIEEIFFFTENRSLSLSPITTISQKQSPQKSNSEVKKSSVDQIITISKEDKFIKAVYPNYGGKSKLQLIDEIFDLKRQNELLQTKVKTYENTINKLL